MTSHNPPEKLSELEQLLPKSGSDPRIIRDSESKVDRLRAWMSANRWDAVLISRRENFAWLTTGGDNHVLKNTELGVGHLLITPEKKYVLAHPMDGIRLQEMQLAGQDYELKTLSWHEGDPRSLAAELAGKRIAADTMYPGTTDAAAAIDQLHEPLTDLEIDRCRWLGLQTALLIESIAEWAMPGLTEKEVERYVRNLFLDHKIELDVMLVGSDERIHRIYHCMPSNKKIERYFLMNPSARRWGLHANVNRCISFGEPPEKVKRDHRAALEIEGRVLCSLEPGLSYSKILEMEKGWYRELGYPDEWKNHFQGGPTGYRLADAYRCFTDQSVQARQSFDWFLTIHGLQVEELTLWGDAGLEILSSGLRWPLTPITWNGKTFQLPTLYVK